MKFSTSTTVSECDMDQTVTRIIMPAVPLVLFRLNKLCSSLLANLSKENLSKYK